jgi:hypothetical protein
MKEEDQYAIENKPSFSGCFQRFCADVFSPKIKRGVLSGVDLHSDWSSAIDVLCVLVQVYSDEPVQRKMNCK